MPADAKHRSLDVMGSLQHNTRWSVSKYKENQIVYAQGDPADSVFYIHRGKVKLSVISRLGKEAIVAIRGPDEFCGEGDEKDADAVGYNDHNVAMRDHAVRDGNRGAPPS